MTLITHYAKSLQLLQPKYELIQIAVTYNLASIAKMGYKDTDNNGIFVKVRNAQEKDDKGEKGEQAQDQAMVRVTLFFWSGYRCVGVDSSQYWSDQH